MKKLFLLFSLLVCVLSLLQFNNGKDSKQQEIEKRALKIDKKDCYNWQDIEQIIFGEIQE